MSGTSDSQTEEMRKIRDEVRDLTSSPLYEYRTQNNYFPVLGEGSHHAKIMFVGEAPGKNEALQGRPFCGASGKLLTQMLENIGMRREDVYITNIVKDRPPDNRDPLPEEIELYGPFLDRQINIIQPKVIVPLGRFAMGYIMEKFGLSEELDSIGKIHGKIFETKPSFGTMHVIPFYHPAAALYGGGTKEKLAEDFQKLRSFVKKVM